MEEIILVCRTRGKSWDYSLVSPAPNTKAFTSFSNWYGLHCSLSYLGFEHTEKLLVDRKSFYCRACDVDSLSKDDQGRQIKIYCAFVSQSEKALNFSEDFIKSATRAIVIAQDKINLKEYGSVAIESFVADIKKYSFTSKNRPIGAFSLLGALVLVPIVFLAKCSI